MLVRKTPLFEPLIYKKRTFYQDRLGTNIGKTQKKRVAFFAGLREVMDPPRPAGAGAGAGAGEEEGEEEAVGPRWWGHFNEWWAPVRAENEVRKTAFTSKRSICQDRLGTNIEKTPKS